MPAPRAIDTSNDWWKDTLARLEQDIESLVDDFIVRLRDLAPEYHGISTLDIRSTARGSLGLLIAQLAGRSSEREIQEFAALLGVRRARQGVDRDLLLEAVRLDYRVLWRGLARLTSQEHLPQLMDRAEEVLSSVEAYIREVQVAFLNEREALAQSSRANESRAVALLLSAEVPGLVAAEVSELLGIRAEASYELVLVPTESAAEAKRIANISQRSRQRFIIWDFDDCVLFLREQGPEARTHLLDGVRGVLMQDVQGLGSVPRAVEAAHLLVPYIEQPRLYREQELWLPLASHTLSSILPCLSETALSKLHQLPETEQHRIVNTFLSYCETGSIKETAERAFVHRNTVVNRLRAFKDSTGLDPTIPLEAARALILVRKAHVQRFVPGTSPASM